MRRRIAGVLAGLVAMGGFVAALWSEPSLASATSATSHASLVGRPRRPDPKDDKEQCEDEKGPEQEGREPDADSNGEKEGHEADKGDACPSPTPSPTPTPHPGDRQSIRVTVPNAIVRIFECSALGTRCRFDHQFQLNPPFNKKVPTVFVNRSVTDGCAGSGEAGKDEAGGAVGEFDSPGWGLAMLWQSQCKPPKPRKEGGERDHHRHGEQARVQHPSHDGRDH